MHIKEITVDFKFVKNLGNYQSCSPMAGVTISLEAGEDYKKAFEKAWNIVGEQVSTQLKLFDEEKTGIRKAF